MFRAIQHQLLLKVFFISIASASLAASGDWPQFRGPNRDGVSTETGLLKDWPAGGPRLIWKATGLGKGYSTVAVVAERIYTLGTEKNSTHAVALNATDGKRIWSVPVGRSDDPGGMGEGPRATPTVDGELLFAVTDSGELVCLDSDKGKDIWRKDYVKDFGGEIPHWGFAESPLVDGQKVVVTPGGPGG